MGKPKSTSYQSAILRKKAEKLLKKKILKTVPELSEAETIKLIHEVEVHQVELDLQNEELTRTISAAQDAIDLYDFAPSGYFSLSQEGEIIKLNFAGSQILGKENSQLINSKFGFFVSDDTKPVFNDFFRRLFDSQVKESCEVTLSINDNLPVHVHLTGIIAKNGEYCLVTMMDITERKQLEDALLNLVVLRAAGELERIQNEAELQQSKQRLEMAQVSSGAGIWDWDMVTHRLHWSKELFLLFGLDPLKDEATFETWGNIIHPDDKDIARFRIVQAIKDKTSLNSEYRVIYDGQVHWIIALGNTTYDESGRPVRMTGICMDITMRKQVEEALHESEVILPGSHCKQKAN